MAGKSAETQDVFSLTRIRKDGIIFKCRAEVWLSLVERYVRDVEAAGSNPVTSTIVKNEQTHRMNLWVCYFKKEYRSILDPRSRRTIAKTCAGSRRPPPLLHWHQDRKFHLVYR